MSVRSGLDPMAFFDLAARGVMWALHRLDPETAHGLTIRLLKIRAAGTAPPDDPALATRICGLSFPNPVGLAAGFDKNAEVPDAMLGLGFGFAEVGTLTPRPQAGNPKPRIFRLTPDRAIINRLGFNNQGLAAAVDRLAARRGRPGIVGVNLGANKDSADRVEDYVTGLRQVAGFADYVTINISSPNTPGLRGLQDKQAVDRLLARLLAARAEVAAPATLPLFLKVAPDLEAEERRAIAEVAVNRGLDGLIVSNTTITRPAGLCSPLARESGGLSGAPLFALSTDVLRDFYRLTEGRLPLIGVGGIGSGRDAYEKIRAGASLVQLYTALTFHGPGLIQELKRELAALVKRDGFAQLGEAVGADHRAPARNGRSGQ